MNAMELIEDAQKQARRRLELSQLRSTEAHVLQLLEDERDEKEREVLMAKYRRTQARRMELSRAVV